MASNSITDTNDSIPTASDSLGREDLHPNQTSSYPAARLKIGMSQVGMVVILCAAFILLNIEQWIVSLFVGAGIHESLSLPVFFCFFALVALPLDILGGWYIPQKHGMSSGATFLKYLSGYIRGALVQLGFYSLTAIAAYWSIQWIGLPGFLMTVMITLVFLIVNTRLLGAMVSGLRYTGQDVILRGRARIVEVMSENTSFSGGISGLPGKETIVLPTKWKNLRGERISQLLLKRRSLAITTGAYARGLILAVSWVVSGAILGLLAGLSLDSSAALIMRAIEVSTIWTFLGLLILPTISRNAVRLIDIKMLEEGYDIDELRDFAATSDGFVAGEYSRSPVVETIFHPLPSTQFRFVSADKSGSQPKGGCWNPVRQMLFYSWAGMNLLSRSVHCNAGMPDLWVHLPTD